MASKGLVNNREAAMRKTQHDPITGMVDVNDPDLPLNVWVGTLAISRLGTIRINQQVAFVIWASVFEFIGHHDQKLGHTVLVIFVPKINYAGYSAHIYLLLTSPTLETKWAMQMGEIIKISRLTIHLLTASKATKMIKKCLFLAELS
jgi:hypothetical protein